MEANERDDYETAATLFEEAYDLDPNFALLWNAARAHHRAGHYETAVARYKQVLKHDELPPDYRPRAAEYLSRARMEQRGTAREGGGAGSTSGRVAGEPSARFVGGFGPLAWRLGSRLVFVGTGVAVAVTLPAALGRALELASPAIMSHLAVTAALLAWPSLSGAADRAARFDGVARGLGLVLWVVTTYVVAFAEVAEGLASHRGEVPLWAWAVAGAPVVVLVPVLRRSLGAWSSWHGGAPATVVAAWALVPLMVLTGVGGPWLVAGANLALAALAGVCITTAVEGMERGPFWFGALLGTALVVTRFVEYDTTLWLKGLVFLAAGVLLIGVGVVFERRVRGEVERAA